MVTTRTDSVSTRFDVAAMADLRDCRARLRVRLLRAADAAAHRAAGACGAAWRRPEQPGGQRMGRHPAVRARGRGRHLRAARRLPHRPVRPPSRAGVEHPALRASRHSRPDTPRRSSGCSSGAAARSSAYASSSSRPSRGCRSSSPIRSSGSASSATRRRSDRSAASW